MTLAGVALYYPAMKLYELIAKKIAARKNGIAGNEDETSHFKAFVPAFRGKYKPHHRHTHENNGHADMQ